MDPLAHTLVGLAVAKSGLEKRSGYATTALVIGSNLPDADGITYFINADLPLLFRRGWTHGIAAIIVLPLLLTAGLVLLDRALGRGRAAFGALYPLSLLAFAMHPALDWLNNYGVRFLMPFGGTWFYGDAVFIVDPWVWLVLGGAVFLAASDGTARMLAWAGLTAVAAFLVWYGLFGPIGGKLLFFAGLAIVVILRVPRLPRTERGLERLNRGALLVVGAYLLAMIITSAAARRFTLAELRARGLEVNTLMVGPVPMTPFVKEVVAGTPENYRFGMLSLWPTPVFTLFDDVVPRIDSSSIAERALAQPEVRGFANWARFPWAEVIEQPNGFRVLLRDARFVRTPNGEGFGTAVVYLPKE